MFAKVDSVHMSPEPLYAASVYLNRAELEQIGSTDEHNALVAFLDRLKPTTLVSGANITQSVRQTGRSR